MRQAESSSNTHLLTSIADGSIGQIQTDRGGNWSVQHGVWVDHRIGESLARLSPAERGLVEILGETALVVGRIYSNQLSDATSGIMYPKKILQEGMGSALVRADLRNPTVSDPYSVVPDLDEGAIPFSRAYPDKMAKLRENLLRARDHNSPSAVSQRQYIEELLNAYELDGRNSDLDHMHRVDQAWVHIPSDVELLFLAEPTEVYADPARDLFRQDLEVAEWARKTTERNKLGPWRNFFEFELLMRDESMISDDEVLTVRRTSRDLFAQPDARVVTASLEFRRLLLTSGNGSFPPKTAKNYPNFTDIRDTQGYKNVLYTNMLVEGTKDIVKPTLQQVFGGDFVQGFNEAQLVRGNTLRVVAHEENHPFRRHEGNTEFEELKATVNGLTALIQSGKFSEEDLRYTFASAIAAELYNRIKVQQARREGDEEGLRDRRAYYTAGTILMNYLKDADGLVFANGNPADIDYQNMARALPQLADELEQVRTGQTSIQQIHEAWGNEAVWERFGV